MSTAVTSASTSATKKYASSRLEYVSLRSRTIESSANSPKPDAEADVPARDDDEREEQADVEHHVDHGQVAAPVTAAVDAVHEHRDGGEIEPEAGGEIDELGSGH